MKYKFLLGLILLLFLSRVAHAQSLAQAEYFVDADPGAGNAVAIPIAAADSITGDLMFSTSGLSPGWHYLMLRAKDTEGKWGVPIAQTFYVYQTQPQTLTSNAAAILQAEYFFDNDPGVGRGTAIPIVRGDTVDADRCLPATGLEPGEHRLYVRVMDEQGVWSNYLYRPFTVTPAMCTMPIPDFTYDTVTYGTPVSFHNLSESIVPGTTWEWCIDNDGTVDYTSMNMVHTFAYAGTHAVKLSVKNDSVCVASIIKDVVTGPLPDTTLLIAGLTSFCEGDSVILTSDNYAAGCTYEWSTGDTTQSITVKSTGDYYVWVTNSYGNFVKSEVVHVEVYETFNTLLITENATGGNANGFASVSVAGASGNYTILWSTGATSPAIHNLVPDVYSVTVTNGHCPSTQPFTISNIPVQPGNILAVEYFFDADPGAGNGTTLNIRAGDTIANLSSLPTTGLTVGFHYVYIRAKNTDQTWGVPLCKQFYVRDTMQYPIAQPNRSPIVYAEYFTETDPGVGNGIPVPVPAGDTVDMLANFPASGFSQGFHSIYLRVVDSDNHWSIYKGTPFFVYDDGYIDLSQTQSPILKAEYFFDTDPGAGNGTALAFNIQDSVDISKYIQVGSLDTGYHYCYIRVLDLQNKWSLWKRERFHIHQVNCTCPVVDFAADTVQVTGNPTLFTNLSSNVAPGTSYEWDVDNDGNVDYTSPVCTHIYPDYGIYSAKLTIHNADSCYASKLQDVVVSPDIDTTLLLTGLTTFCEGDSLVIAAQPGYSYYWNTQDTTRSITVKSSGNYFVILNNTFGLQKISRKVSVIVNPVPEVSVLVTNATGGVSNGSAISTATGGSGVYSYQWSTGESFPVENNLPAGDHWLVVDDGHCPVQKFFHIDNAPVIPGDIVGAEYYFDSDPGIGNGVPLNIAAGDTVSFTTYLPVTNLSLGSHRLNIRARDTEQRWSHVLTKDIFVFDTATNSQSVQQPPITRAEYFFDEDPGFGNGFSVPITAGEFVVEDFQVPTMGLSVGQHSIFIRVADAENKWSLISGSQFYIYDSVYRDLHIESPKIVAAEYFFDTDPGAGNGIAIPFTPTADVVEFDRYLPVGSIPSGNHKFYIRVKDEAGKWSIYSEESFEVYSVTCLFPVPAFVSDTVSQGLATSFTNTSSNLLPGSGYHWDINNDGLIDYTSKNITHTFTEAGVHDVKMTVINGDSCQASVIQQVFVGTVPDNAITVAGNTVFCDGDSVVLTAAPGYTYQWWPTNEITQSIVVKTSGTFYAWINNGEGIEIQSQIVNTAWHERPLANLTIANATSGLNNGSAVLEVTGGSGLYDYVWSSGSTNYYANDLSEGNYSVIVNDGYCPVQKDFYVANDPINPLDLVYAEYFFNTDPGPGNGINMNVPAGDTIDFVKGISVAGLNPGRNQLYVRAMDTDHTWGIVHEQTFFVYDTTTYEVAEQPPLVYAEFFIDRNPPELPDPGVGNGPGVEFSAGDSVSIGFTVLADTLSVGFYKAFVRAQDENNKWGLLMSTLFYVYDTTYVNLLQTQPDIVSAEYFFDSDPGVGLGNPIVITAGSLIDWAGGFNISSLAIGSHYLYIRTKDAEGKWGIPGRVGFGVFDCVQPYADFTIVPTCIQNPVQIQDNSTNVANEATYEWDIFNDGTIDYTTHGSIAHQFTEPGNYQIKLKITHNVACVDSVIKTIVFPSVQLPNDTTIYTDQVLVLDAGAGYEYQWNTGQITQTITVDGQIAGVGAHLYKVVVFDAAPCSDADSLVVTIIPPPRDLVIDSMVVAPDSLPYTGAEIGVSVTVKNQGTISAIANVVNFYLSSDSIIDPADQFLGFEIVEALEGGYSQTISSNFEVPPGIAGTQGYLLARVDGSSLVVESNEDNNTNSQSFVYYQTAEKLLTGNLFIQGLYNFSGSMMNKARNENGFQWPGNVADKIDIWLCNESKPYNVVHQIEDVDLMQNGTFSALVPYALSGNLYLVISHRNSIETWSALPVDFSQSFISYDFTQLRSMAYLGNMFGYGEIFMLYSGDVNQDGVVDLQDIILIENKAHQFQTGYMPQDVNGDGVVDALDLIVTDNNAANAIRVLKPD